MNNGLLGFGGPATLPFATTALSQDGASSTTISSPARVRDSILGLVRLQWSTNTQSSGGTVSGNQAQVMWSLNTSTTTNGVSILRAESAGNAYQMWSYTGYDRIDWSKPRTVALRCYRQLISANGVWRLQLGAKSSYTALGQLNGAGVGVEIRNRRLWLLAHNGTVLVQNDTNIDAPADAAGTVFELILRSDSVGGVSITYTTTTGSTTYAINSGGPTASAIGTLSSELGNYTDATANAFLMSNPYVTFA